MKISADVIRAVLQTALLGFFIDFTKSEITSPLPQESIRNTTMNRVKKEKPNESSHY